MLLRTSKGMFQVLKNTKNAFDISTFESRYIEECFDMYSYIVGDLSSNILRLKGFNNDPKSNNYYKKIDNYIFDSCAFRCPVYVLRRIKDEDEYDKLLKNPEPVDLGDEKGFTLVKENFDMETLVLESTPKGTPNIVINLDRMNKVTKVNNESKVAEPQKANNKTNNQPQNNRPEQTNNKKKNKNNSNKNNNNNNQNNNQNNNSKPNNNTNNNQKNLNPNNVGEKPKNKGKKFYYKNKKKKQKTSGA